MTGFRVRRLPLLAAGALALLTGIWLGLLRLGWAVPFWRYDRLDLHGPLMIGGFLGTVISLERAVALGRWWAWGPPLATAMGAATLVVGASGPWAPGLIGAGSAGLAAVSLEVVRRQPALHNVAMGLGAACWLGGNALWLSGAPLLHVVPWWAGFLVLTIAGERLELNRLLRPSPLVRTAFSLAAAVLLAGLAVGATSPQRGWRLSGAGLLALAAWLLVNDVARRTVRRPGLPRFTALCLLSGYVWLAISGAIALAHSDLTQGLEYDALLHAVFLGFVFAMIFGHAPIVFPAVLGVPIPMRGWFYVHLSVLHLSVLTRVAADLTEAWLVRRWAGLANAAAVALFLAGTAAAAVSARRREAAGPARGRAPVLTGRDTGGESSPSEEVTSGV